MSADDDDIDDASLKSMRAVWLSMRDEEPPAAGMSALMAAAAQKADQLRAEPSWWERLVTQLRRPPALAFATVMLLIGGAVLVTRSQSEKVEALTAEDRPVAREQEAPVATPTTGIAPADPVAEPKEEALKQQPEAASDVRSKLEKQKPKAKPAVVEEEEVGKNEPDRDHRFEADADMKPGFAGGKASGEDKTVIETPAHKTQAPTIAQPPAEPEPRPSADEGDTLTRGNAGPPPTAPKKPEATKDRGSPVPANEQLAKRVEELAARGDCAAVRELVAKIRNSDEAFYKQRLGKNAAVTKCL